MSIKFESIKNWANFSEQTKDDIMLSSNSFDAIGLIMTERYNPTECIRLLQSLADPKYIGEIKSKTEWERTSYTNIDGFADSCDEYNSNGGYTSYALKANPNKMGLTLPLVLNYSKDGRMLPGACDKYDKIIESFETFLGKTIEHMPLSTNKKFLEENRKSIVVFSENNGKQINKFEEIILLSNLVAEKLLEDSVKSFKEDRKQYKSKDLEVIDEITKLILTLGIVRTIKFGNPEASHQIDEALKLQISNSIAIVETSSNHFMKTVAKQAKTCINNFKNIAEFPISSIVANMKENGFKYANEKQITDYSSAVYNANNLFKIFGVEMEKPLNLALFKAKALHALGSAAVTSRGKTNLKAKLPGLFDSLILSNGQMKKITTEEDPYLDAIGCIMHLLKGDESLLAPVTKKYSETKTKIINDVLRRFNQQRPEDEGKSYKKRLNDILNAEYSEDGKVRNSGSIVRQIVKNIIKQAKAEQKANKKKKSNEAEL